MKAAVNHNLAGLPEEMEECMDDVFLDAVSYTHLTLPTNSRV
mgnify:CR=1 FL=1